jgi:hypothetical protein
MYLIKLYGGEWKMEVKFHAFTSAIEASDWTASNSHHFLQKPINMYVLSGTVFLSHTNNMDIKLVSENMGCFSF